MEEYLELYKHSWSIIGKNNETDDNFDVEFDWIGMDKNNNNMALFISFNRGYIPLLQTKSLKRYCELMSVFDNLSRISKSTQVSKSNIAKLEEFIEIAEKGFWVYNNSDIHSTVPLNKYELLLKPITLLKIVDCEIHDFTDIIPRFNLIFSADLSFKLLKEQLVK